MKILVGCEESQVVCIEFRKRGHEAYSCDLLPCSGGHPEWHLKMDVFKAIGFKKWDLIIMHPPCTAIAVSGNSTYGFGKEKYYMRIESVKWIQKLWDYAISRCNKVVMENPVGVLNTMGNFPKPQYIQPYEHGHRISKKTGLWLVGLPELKPTNIVEPEWIYYKNGGRCSPDHYKNAFSKKRGLLRSKTYPGIAAAFATQWSEDLTAKT